MIGQLLAERFPFGLGAAAGRLFSLLGILGTLGSLQLDSLSDRTEALFIRQRHVILSVFLYLRRRRRRGRRWHFISLYPSQ